MNKGRLEVSVMGFFAVIITVVELAMKSPRGTSPAANDALFAEVKLDPGRIVGDSYKGSRTQPGSQDPG